MTLRDALPAAVLTAALEAELAIGHHGGLVVAIAGGLAAVALAWRRSRPLAALAVVVAAFIVNAAAGGRGLDNLGSADLVLVVAAFAVGAQHRARVTLIAVGAAAAGLAVAGALSATDDYSVLDDFVWFLVVQVGAPALAGRLLASRRRAADALHDEIGELAAGHAAAAAAAREEERVRLSLRLHDAVAHRVGEIALQASGAERVAGADPAAARAALVRIEATARTILTDIRDVLGWLRHPRLEPETPVPDAGTPRAWRMLGHVAPERVDAAIALVLGAAIGVEVATSRHATGPAWLNALLVAGLALPLAARRRAPVVSVTASLTCAVLLGVFATPISGLVTPVALVFLAPYSVAAHARPRAAIAGLGVSLVATGALTVLGPGNNDGLVPTLVLALVAWATGWSVRRRDHGVGRLRNRSEHLRAERAAAERLAVAEERGRIARDLHDVVAHSMTAIVLQAGGAARVWDEDPPRAQAAVGAVGEVARDALGQLRRTLPTIEENHSGPSLDDLVRRARASGLAVSLSAAPVAAAPGVDAAIRSTVAEALTNAARYAGGAAVAVSIGVHDDRIVVEVADDGGAVTGVPGTGTGLVGVRERVAAAGGSLHAGPRPGGGFLVRAALPR